MRNAIKQVDINYDPQIYFLSVSRKHTTRFFENSSQSNPPPGTVVDHKITENAKEFYLLSHELFNKSDPDFDPSTDLILKPTYYKCHCSPYDMETSIKMIQTSCYALCHLVGQSPNPTALPVPVHYAMALLKRCELFARNCENFEVDFNAEKFNEIMKSRPYFT